MMMWIYGQDGEHRRLITEATTTGRKRQSCWVQMQQCEDKSRDRSLLPIMATVLERFFLTYQDTSNGSNDIWFKIGLSCPEYIVRVRCLRYSLKFYLLVRFYRLIHRKHGSFSNNSHNFMYVHTIHKNYLIWVWTKCWVTTAQNV